MNSTKSSKPTNPPSSSLSSHFAMIELKQRVLTSLSKLSDRNTHQIAVEDLEKIILTLSPDGVSMLLSCLYDATNDPKPAVKKESIRLLAVLCEAQGDSTATHLTKIIAHIVKRLKDSDSGVRDACRDAVGALSSRYLKVEGRDNGGLGPVVLLFVKPLFEAMGEQNKTVQAGSAMCMAKMVECASDPPVSAFQKLCPRICKYLNNPNFLAKASLLRVVASLSQVGAVAPQSLEPLLQSIHECLGSIDWATRKTAADTLSALALHSGNLVMEGSASTLSVLEACRFDKIKPVRDSITEALHLWKKFLGKRDGASDDQKISSHDGECSDSAELSEKKDVLNPGEKTEKSAKYAPSESSSTNSVCKTKSVNISDKAVGILKKKAPALTDKELNSEFFQKLETRGSGDLPIEVVVPRRCPNSLSLRNEEESGPSNTDFGGRLKEDCLPDDGSVNFRQRCIERGTTSAFLRPQDTDDSVDLNKRESSGIPVGISKADIQSEGFMQNKGNWLAIQKQLLQLERQQVHLMNMLQEFMGGSHNSMVTLENRVHGLEQVVEDMARDLSTSTGRRVGNYMLGLDGSSNKPLGKYSGITDFSSVKMGRGGDGLVPLGDRFAPSDGISSGTRLRGPFWRFDVSDSWDTHSYGKHSHMGSRRVLSGVPIDARLPKSSESQMDVAGSRRAWDKGVGPVRFGEGPSARSVWQASKDEATLEAIRVAGEENGTARTARVALPELNAEAMGDANGQERDPIWTCWSNAMDAVHAGDMDTAFAEVLSTGEDVLLVKLMERSGPVLDQLSSEVASEVLHAVAQFLLEQNLFDISLSWIQQLVDIAVENGADISSTPMEVRRELLLNLHEASSTVELPGGWEGMTPDQLLLQLASVWQFDLQWLEK